jgi:transposase
MRKPPKFLSERAKRAIPQLLEHHTYQEVADRYGVSAMTVWRWHNRDRTQEPKRRRRTIREIQP